MVVFRANSAPLEKDVAKHEATQICNTARNVQLQYGEAYQAQSWQLIINLQDTMSTQVCDEHGLP
jgi:hypothetical protein